MSVIARSGVRGVSRAAFAKGTAWFGLLFLIVWTMFVAGCGGDDTNVTPPPTDSGADVKKDTGTPPPDTGSDRGTVVPDSAPDTTPDATPDRAPDATPDVAPDVT